jgi:hypothetical protein
MAVMLLSLIRRGRILALQLATIAPNPETSGTGRGGRHLLAGGLRIAISLVIGLPLIGVLQVFIHTGLLFFVSFAVFVILAAVQIHKARKLSKDVPMGTEWLLSRLMETTNVKPDIDIERTGVFRIIRLGPTCPCLEHQLSQLKLAERTGVTIAALLRNDKTPIPLHPSPTLQLDDRLVLLGSEHALVNAEAVLTGHQ